jgi:integrase
MPFKPTPILDSLMDRATEWNDLPAEIDREVRKYAAMTHSPGTKVCYEKNLEDFRGFCDEPTRAFPADPNRVAAFAIALDKRGLSAFTIRNKLIAIATVHRANNWPSIYTYKVRTVMHAIMREGKSPRRRKRPVSIEHLKAIYDVNRRESNRVRACRNWAMILIGFWGALRRSELAGLKVEYLELTDEGLTYYIPRSKADPYGNGETVCIPANARLNLCRVRALAAWLRVARITEGPVFREVTAHGTIGTCAIKADAIHRVVKAYLESLGHNGCDYGAHSLRRGWATHAYKTGQSMMSLKRHLRHGSLKYTREYVDGPAAGEHNLSQKAGA